MERTYADPGLAVLDEVLETIEKKIGEGEAPPDEKETIDAIKKRAKEPPSEGPCKMCKQMRMLNRLLLCYECWVKDQLHKQSGGEWLPGDPHLSTCRCDAPGGCSTKNQGN